MLVVCNLNLISSVVMWLLETATAKLHEFLRPEDVYRDGGYAILSHVWNKHPEPKEQSFKEVQKIVKRCVAEGTNPRDHVSDKIRRCCEIAEADGYKWIWNDTCCIDKSSSAELSEAINSMFHYYALSQICYVYLKDVREASAFGIHPLTRDTLVFSTSQWHRRGWTLQELLAPHNVLFLSREWIPLGSKIDLAGLLHKTTGIPITVLALERSFRDFTVAQRMSWASHRKTTRVEDEAYSLLGLFEISMPILYGEGKRAFLRLQEEIMRRSTDTTLLAWGDELGYHHLDWSSLDRSRETSPLFASHPRDFWSVDCTSETTPPRQQSMVVQVRHCTDTLQCSTRMTIFHDQTSLLSTPIKGEITCTRTPRGVMAHIPVMKLLESSGRTFYLGELGWSVERGYVESGTSRAFLVLLPLDDGDEDPPSSPRAFEPCALHGQVARLVTTPDHNLETCFSGSWTWMDIHLIHRDNAAEPSLPIIPINNSYHSPFHFPNMDIIQFMTQFTVLLRYRPLSIAVSHVDVPWSGSPPATFAFAYGSLNPALVIQVGLCSAHLTEVPGPSSGHHVPGYAYLPLWARAIYHESLGKDMDQHSCSTDHVDDWPDKQRCFKGGRPYVQQFHTVLSFVSRPSRDNMPARQLSQLKASIVDRTHCPIDPEFECACSQAISVPHDN